MADTRQARPETDAVDAMLPIPKLAAYGMQHVLVMSAGAVAPPLIIGAALNLSAETVAFLINCDLFVTGLAILIQSLGLPGFGVRDQPATENPCRASSRAAAPPSSPRPSTPTRISRASRGWT